MPTPETTKPEPAPPLTRRAFALTSGALTVAGLLGSAEPALAQTTSTANIGPRPKGLADADWSELQARYANVLRVYGERLSAEARRRIRSILITNQHMLASIRSFTLENSDPSACTVRLVRPDRPATRS